MNKVVSKRGNRNVKGIYVGRPSIWGNPFVSPRDGTRDEVVAKYEMWAWETFTAADIVLLKDSDLICWCAPLRCHADVLLEMTTYLVTGLDT